MPYVGQYVDPGHTWIQAGRNDLSQMANIILRPLFGGNVGVGTNARNKGGNQFVDRRLSAVNLQRCEWNGCLLC